MIVNKTIISLFLCLFALVYIINFIPNTAIDKITLIPLKRIQRVMSFALRSSSQIVNELVQQKQEKEQITFCRIDLKKSLKSIAQYFHLAGHT